MTGTDLKKIEKNLPYAIGMAESILNKNYLSNLSDYEIVCKYEKEFPDSLAKKLNSSVRFFDITQIVLNKNENMRDKLVSVFNAVGNTGASLLMQIKGRKEKVEIRLGINSHTENNEKTTLAKNVLKNSLKANFPGTEIEEHFKETEEKDGKKIETTKSVLENVFKDFSATKTIVTVTDVAGLRSEEETHERKFMQGIEKLIDSMHGKEYTLFLIADPVSLTDLNENRRALEEIYTSLVPFSSSQYSIGENESVGVNESISVGASDTITKSIAHSVSHTIGKSFTETTGTSRTETTGTSRTETNGTSSNTNINPGAALGLIGGAIGFAVGGPGGAMIGGAIGGGIGGTFSFSKGKNHSVSEGTNHSVSNSDNHSVSHGTNESDTTGKTTSDSTAHSDSLNISKGTNKELGESKNIQIQFENHTVRKLMEKIDKILDRYDSCADLGMWNCATYCISDKDTAQMLASVYRSIIRGKNSSLESSSITVWDSESKKAPAISEALRHFEHPILKYGEILLTPGTLISSAELAIHAGLPNHSVPGIPVLECAEFGRTVSIYGKTNFSDNENTELSLGEIWHMNHKEDLPVKLNTNSLSSHTFITGSTGSGKSNTIYQLLSELKMAHWHYKSTDGDEKSGNIHFLVVEPAKGEYKNVFGVNSDVSVFGTNPDLSPLLRINPFSFPHGNESASKNIHILEHIDRLIEIFNVCWPMYAAMPAVLKEAIEKAYEDCGWDLTESTNEYGSDLYPTFADVTRNIRTIIDSSEYDAENKGAYKGSLITRLKSLTNGINGLILTTKELENKNLFDKNVIVDLSRVGSTETKSLIMGFLVLKLQEYRITSGVMNAQLQHVTVLEEAHNLLKRTSTEQSQESGNLLGKSVEMLTNSIAEMRTYGEGFIIADQAPALLDMAVIRNTNTKIIMRLPDKDDRELVGKAANLNDDQIIELAKLPRGVAAVYQNEWVEAVLCKVKHFTGNVKPWDYKKTEKQTVEDNVPDRLEIAKLLYKGIAVTTESELEELNKKLNKLNLRASTVVQILRSIRSPLESPRYTKLAPIVSELFPTLKDSFIASFNRTSDTEQWTIDVDNAIREQIQSNMEEELLRSIRQCIITDYLHNDLRKTELLEKWSNKGGAK